MDLMHRVEELAAEGHGKAEIAKQLGIKNASTFNTRLIHASQETRRPIPTFKRGSKTRSKKPVEVVEVRRRGKGSSYGVNIPQEPLERLGVRPGDRLAVVAKRDRIVLSIADSRTAAQAPAGPRLVKNRTSH